MTKQMMKRIATLSMLVAVCAYAEKAGVKVDDISTNEDTAITIKKGAHAADQRDFEVVEGHDEVTGDPDNERAKAYGNWKSACSEWKTNMREMNKENMVLTLNCNAAVQNKDGYLISYKSNGSYKLRVRIREKK